MCLLYTTCEYPLTIVFICKRIRAYHDDVLFEVNILYSIHVQSSFGINCGVLFFPITRPRAEICVSRYYIANYYCVILTR